MKNKTGLIIVVVIAALSGLAWGDHHDLRDIVEQVESGKNAPAEIPQEQQDIATLKEFEKIMQSYKMAAKTARTETITAAELENKISKLEEYIDKKLSYQMQCNNKAIDSVNTSISGATYALMIFGLIVTLGGIGLGIYIARQVRNVTHIAKQSKSILKIRDEVRDIDEKIKNNMSALYNDLKDEETKALIERLCEVPEDIINLFPILASRFIPKELFPQMKKAYQSLSNETNAYYQNDHYRILFFQHFASLAIFDADLQNEMEDYFPNLIQNSFKNDILETSEGFIKSSIKDGNILDFSEKIKKYFIALHQSKFRDCAELHNHIYKTLLTKENRFNLYSILQLDIQLKDIAIIYGKHLLSNYKDITNTDAENKILLEIAEAIEPKSAEATKSPDETAG